MLQPRDRLAAEATLAAIDFLKTARNRPMLLCVIAAASSSRISASRSRALRQVVQALSMYCCAFLSCAVLGLGKLAIRVEQIDSE